MDTTISATTNKSPLAVLFVFTLIFSTSMTPAQSQFCSDRPGGCCPGRDDACTVPRGDTLCYCDEFCLRSKDPDCCPDVFNNCTALPVTVAPLSPNPLKSRLYLKKINKKKVVLLCINYPKSQISMECIYEFNWKYGFAQRYLASASTIMTPVPITPGALFGLGFQSLPGCKVFFWNNS